MRGMIDRYLDKVLAVADLGDPAREEQVRNELRDHLEQKVDALVGEGYDRAEALVKAVEDHGNPILIGYRLRPWRLVDVRLRGTARGVIAIGPRARGIVAIGGLAMGVFALGGVAIGAISFGGCALGLLLAWGGLAGGGLAYGGCAVGVVAFGGMAVGVIASGATAAGLWVPGAANVLWSHFTWQTVPAWWRAIGEWLSFNPNSVEEREAFSTMVNVMNGVAMLFLFVMLMVQGFMTKKEHARLGQIDRSFIE